MARHGSINDLDADQLAGSVLGQSDNAHFTVIVLGEFRDDGLHTRLEGI